LVFVFVFWRLKTAFFALSMQDVEKAADRRGSFLTCQPALRHPSIPGPGDYAACFSHPLPMCFLLLFSYCQKLCFRVAHCRRALQLRRSPPAPQPCPPACWLDLSPMPGAKLPPYPFCTGEQRRRRSGNGVSSCGSCAAAAGGAAATGESATGGAAAAGMQLQRGRSCGGDAVATGEQLPPVTAASSPKLHLRPRRCCSLPVGFPHPKPGK
jgi:hypothetical protein